MGVFLCFNRKLLAERETKARAKYKKTTILSDFVQLGNGS